MIVIDIEQNSPEWYSERCGIPTASNFDRIVAIDKDSIKSEAKEVFKREKNIKRLSKKQDKEDFEVFAKQWLKENLCCASKGQEKYLYQLAGERITKVKEDSYQSSHMARGKEIEQEALDFYSVIYGLDVQKVGFCYKDENKLFGCSPDGLIEENGLIEVKCPSVHTHVSYLLANVLPLEYYQQVQGQLLVTGRDWCDFISYYPGIKPLIVRVNREEKFIKKLEEELIKFNSNLQKIVERIS